ncbi:hypothetical protein [Longibaculum muris]|uniref:hypothetical protein n=1 Tax=Longibaculum muris TaxID=1796628 RepID=UPI0022E42716|nr:hypothetical protein [Longibaculum muris]
MKGKNVMLKDLSELIKSTKNLYSRFEEKKDYRLSDDFKNEFHKYLRNNNSNQKIRFNGNTSLLFTGSELNIFIPNQWFLIATYATELVRTLIQYKEIVDDFIYKKIFQIKKNLLKI